MYSRAGSRGRERRTGLSNGGFSVAGTAVVLNRRREHLSQERSQLMFFLQEFYGT